VELFTAETPLLYLMKNCNVIFCNNSATNLGGAIYQTHSVWFFRENALVTLKSNLVANSAGGAICQNKFHHEHKGGVF